jgi:hypothetical protein
MTSMTKLLNIVISNNYDELEKVLSIVSKKNININFVKHSKTLISKAVEHRSKECFDLLIACPEYRETLDKEPFFNGFDIALHYYLLAPNSSNLYYINNLINANVNFNVSSLVKCSSNNDIFTILFNRLDKSKNNVKHLIKDLIIYKDNINTIINIYDWLEHNQSEFYNSYETRKEFNNDIFNNLSYVNNYSFVNFIIEKEIDWKYIDNKPSLYNYYIKEHWNIFELFLTKYKNLSNEELNNIPNIKILETLFSRFEYGNNSSLKLYYDNLKKIFELPIEFNDIAKNIRYLYELLIDNYITINNSSNVFKKFDIILNIIYFLAKSKHIKSNPLLTFPNNYKQIFDNIIKRFNTDVVIKNTYCSYIRKLKIIAKHFGWEPNTNIKTIFNSAKLPKDFSINKELFIEELENKVFEQNQSKKKNSRKSKAKDNDIEV